MTITAELIKEGEELHKKIFKRIKRIWSEELIPNEWKTHIIPTEKGVTGKLSICSTIYCNIGCDIKKIRGLRSIKTLYK